MNKVFGQNWIIWIKKKKKNGLQNVSIKFWIGKKKPKMEHFGQKQTNIARLKKIIQLTTDSVWTAGKKSSAIESKMCTSLKTKS